MSFEAIAAIAALAAAFVLLARGASSRRARWLLLLGWLASCVALLADPDAMPRAASPCLLSAGVLMPAGFLLGGLVVYGGDPGLGILLLPIGAALLLVGLAAVAWGVMRSR